MDPRRLLIPTALVLSLPGCALMRDDPVASTVNAVPVTVAPPAEDRGSPSTSRPVPISPGAPDPQDRSPTERPYYIEAVPSDATDPTSTPSITTGRRAIAAANATARAASREDAFVGGMQVFTWSPGRVFEVWTAPLRVTTLTLAPGETLVAKAAGDTVRWQIGEVVSGAGSAQRTHVLLKPLEQGLETNLVLTTDRRLYLIHLKSGTADAFNAIVAWDREPLLSGGVLQGGVDGYEASADAQTVITPQGDLDARYRIEPQGRRPRWTPTSVFNDGIRTFITFDADLQVDEAPALFVIAAGGEAQMVNYRQVGGLYVVDRVFDRAELRLGGRRPQTVRIRRLAGGR